jgi:hypothetical protein
MTPNIDKKQTPDLTGKYAKVLEEVIKLKVFLISAPANFTPGEVMKRYHLPTDEVMSCVYWNNVFYITGTDIVRCLTYRFEAFGRVVRNRKKFEEGIFSDLRNLKCDTDAVLEEPKSNFLSFLYKNNCVRTQKKQKIFHWYSVSHDRLFLDALERDLKKDQAGKKASTEAVGEPALSFKYDGSVTLHDQLADIIDGIPKPLAAIADASTSNSMVGNYPSAIPYGAMTNNHNRPQYLAPPPIYVQSQPEISYQSTTVSSITTTTTAAASAYPEPEVYINPSGIVSMPILSTDAATTMTGDEEPFLVKPYIKSDFPLDYFLHTTMAPGLSPSGMGGVADQRFKSAAKFLADEYPLHNESTPRFSGRQFDPQTQILDSIYHGGNSASLLYPTDDYNYYYDNSRDHGKPQRLSSASSSGRGLFNPGTNKITKPPHKARIDRIDKVYYPTPSESGASDVSHTRDVDELKKPSSAPLSYEAVLERQQDKPSPGEEYNEYNGVHSTLDVETWPPAY